MTHMSKAHSVIDTGLSPCKYLLIPGDCRNFRTDDVVFQVKRFAFRA
jgi:hypothetical protein